MSEYKRVAENLFIRERTGRYYAIIKKNGVQTRKSLRTHDRGIAESRLLALQAQMRVAKMNPLRRDLPTLAAAVEEVISHYRNERTNERYLVDIGGHLGIAARSWLGPIKINRITSDHLQGYLAERNREYSGKTANLDLTFFRKLFLFAKGRGWRWDNPTDQVEGFKHRTKRIAIPTREEVLSILEWLHRHSDHPDYPKAADFIEFLALSGCRLHGAQTIKWADIDFERKIFQVTEKFSKTRIVDIFPWLMPFLTARRKTNGLLFPPSGYNPKKSLAMACKKTGVTRITFHSLRHFFATECLERGISAPTIAGWLGHSDNGILVMRLYGNHLRRQHFAAEAQKLPPVLFSPSVSSSSVPAGNGPTLPGGSP